MAASNISNMNGLRTFWFFRYKLHHLVFWALYHFSWSWMYKGSVGHAFKILQSTPSLISFVAYVIFQAIGVYFCLYYLMPRFLEKGRYVIFLGLLMLTVVVMGLFIYASHFVGAWIVNEDIATLYGLDGRDPIDLFKYSAFPASLSSMTLGMTIKLTKNWIEAQRRRQELEKEKLETELKFLKSQINPHFLFNTINSIFVLIRRNPDMASDALSKFSDMLRYQLYECNGHEIPLRQECTYLKNYIQLEKLRHDASNLVLSVEMEVADESSMIAPFILMPFVENAFKHVSRRKESYIRMKLSLEEGVLYFRIENSVEGNNNATMVFEYGGIGLANVKRRLDLIYPLRHRLSIEPMEELFRVSLQLRLDNSAQTKIAV